MSPAEEQQLCSLLSALREGCITDSERDRLNQWVIENPQVRKAFVAYMKMCGHLFAFQLAAGIDRTVAREEKDEDVVLWQALAEDERNAPTLAIAEKVEPVELVRNVRDRKLMLKESRKRVPVSVWVSFMAAAAMLLIIAVVSMKSPQIEVATVADCVDVKMSSALPLQKGTRLRMSAEPVVLRRGIVKIESDKGVQVVIEAPAEFRFLNADEITLTCGRLTAFVPDSGSGFAVRTNNSKIIDLGTRFGVYADFRGQTELHMFEGKTVVIAGQDSHPKQIVEVGGGRAVRVDLTGQGVEDIPLQPDTFAHDIDSDAQLIWRHDRYIDLADIVGGGDGTGSGSRNSAISWDGKKLVPASDTLSANSTAQAYVPVSCSPFIDGVFIPNSKGLPVKLNSSTGDLDLDEFLSRDTNGLVTLLLVREDSDRAGFYWFGSKEGAAGDAGKMPFLYLPRGADGQPAYVTTADGRGADTCIMHDGQFKSGRLCGQDSFLQCRYIKDERLRIIFLRFDISRLKGDLSEAILNLYLDMGNRKRSLAVYGLADGPADFWDEKTLDYGTAPGLRPAPSGNYELDESLCTRLGSFSVIDNRASDRSVVIDSEGLFKWMAPESIGRTLHPVANVDTFRNPRTAAASPLRLGTGLCGTRDNPSILMHANAGITFDLQALRQTFGPLQSFTALCGVSWSPAAEIESPSASFYVLLDGQEVFTAVDLMPDNDPETLTVDLPADKRYLTLITTQGTDGSLDNDLCLFVKPEISMQKPAAR